MYQQHVDVSVLASQGIEQSTDPTLKDLSGKIRYEQTKDNQKLAYYYRKLGYGAMPVNYTRGQIVVDSLAGVTPPNFNLGYARSMIAILRQTIDAADLGGSRLANVDLRYQSGLVANSAEIEIIALKKWMALNAPGGPIY